MTNSETARLQSWLNDIITCQGNMEHKLYRANNLYNLHEEDVIADTRDVSIYSRLHVYTSGYVMRLLECTHADFPVLRKFMGEEVFDKFARAALTWSPSTSYSLYDLGETFIRFLEGTRPKNSLAQGQQSIFLELPIEIARVERARQQVLRSRGLEGEVASSEFQPEEILFNPQSIRLSRPECLQLLDLKFSLKPLFNQFNTSDSLEVPEVKQTYLAVSRMNYRLQMEELLEWQYHFLNFCTESASIFEAVNRTAVQCNIPASTLMAELFVWLPIFIEKGFVRMD